MKKGELAHLATQGAVLSVRVTPGAGRNEVTIEGDRIKVSVTAQPEGGKANAAVLKLLAKALGVAKSRLTLAQGATSRDKAFRLD